MSWLEKLVPSRIKTRRRTRSVPEGLWSKCPGCDSVLYRAEVERNVYVCPKCSHHMRIGARQRLELFLDPGGIEEVAPGLDPQDPLKFKDSKRYRDRLIQAQKASGAPAAVRLKPQVTWTVSGARTQSAAVAPVSGWKVAPVGAITPICTPAASDGPRLSTCTPRVPVSPGSSGPAGGVTVVSST